MGLNDETLNEFDSTEGAGLTPPGEVNTSQNDTTTIAVEPGTDSEESDKVIEGLEPDVEVLIQTKDEKELALHSMEEVAQVILAKESISQSDIEFLIQSSQQPELRQELEENVAPVASFTASPTSVNLQATKQFLLEKVNRMKLETQGAYATVLKGRVEHVFEIQKTVSGRIDDLISVANFLRSQAANDLQKAVTSKNLTCWVQIPNTDEEAEKPVRDILVNLSLCSLNGYSLHGAEIALEKTAGITKALREEMREVISSHGLVSILKKAEAATGTWEAKPYETRLTDYFPNAEGESSSDFMSMTYNKLLGILSSDLLPLWLEGAKVALTSDLDAIKHRLEKADSENQETRQFTAEELHDLETKKLAKSTIDYISHAIKVNNTVRKLEDFYRLSSVILEQFRKIL